MLRGLFGTLAVVLVAAGPPPAERELNDKTLVRWRDRIRPKSEELNFNTVKWLPTFWDAVMAAQKDDKPILLWAMNGHPLACT
jgi:hypothetical protein